MPTRTDAVAQVYARSLYELAEEAGGRDKILEVAGELEQICELSREDRAFGEFLRSPIVDRARRGAALRRIFDGEVTDLVLRFLLVLNQKRRLAHLETICDAYDQLVHAAFGRIEVDVYTATPLSPAQREAIKKRISQKLGKEAVLYADEDPSMIGGLKLRIGDQLIDGSVASRLRRMRQRLRESGAELATEVHKRLSRFIEEGAEP